jgi:hypothetical protein
VTAALYIRDDKVIMKLPDYCWRKICLGSCSTRKTFVDGNDLLFVYILIYIVCAVIYHLSSVVFMERNELPSPTANMETQVMQCRVQ